MTKKVIFLVFQEFWFKLVKYERVDALSRWHQQKSTKMDIHGPLETCKILLKKKLFSEVCAFLKENFEDDSCVLTLYQMENGKTLPPPGERVFPITVALYS